MESKGPGSRAAGPFCMCNVPGAIAINIITVPLETPEGDDVASAAGIDCARKGVKRRIFRWCARSVIANRGDGQNDSSFLPSPVRPAPSRWPQCHVVRLVAQPSFLSKG